MRLKISLPTAAARPLRQRNSPAAWFRLAFRAVAILAVVLVVVVVGGIVVVLVGRTDFGFVRDQIAATLRSNLGPGYSVAIKRAVIDTDPVLGLVVRVDDIVVRDDRQAVVVEVPETRFVVDPYSLLRLHVDIRTVEFNAPQLSFLRTSDGRVMLGAAPTFETPAADAAPSGGGGQTVAEGASPPVPGPAPATTAAPDADSAAAPAADADAPDFPDLVTALKILDSGIEPPIDSATAAGFERLSVVNGVISVWDASEGQQRRFSSTDLSVSLDPRTSALTVNFATSGYSGRWQATVERDLDANSGGHALSITFSQLTLADVIPAFGNDKGLFVADVPLYGRASMHISADGEIEDASARIDAGAGTLRFREDLTAKQESVLLDEATVRLHWDIPHKAIVIDPSTFFFGNTRGLVTGTIKPDGDPAAGRYVFDFESPGTVMAPPDSGAPAMVAQRISLAGTADLRARTLSISNAVIVTANGSVAAAGKLGFEPGKTPSLALAASFSPMPVATMKTIWIPFIAPAARHWVMEHLISGELTEGSYEASVPAGVLWGKPVQLPDKAMRLDMQLKNVTFTTIGKVPAVTKASGNVVLSGSTFGVDVNSGEVDLPTGTVKVEAAAFAIPNVAKRPADGIVEFQLAGPVAAIAAIADADPINALAQRDLSPNDLSGTADASLSVRFPLRDEINEAEVDWKVVAKIKNGASKAPIDGRTLSDADVTLTVAPDDVTVYGKAKIDGLAADVSMSLPTEDGGALPKPGERQVRLVLDDAARKRLGVGLEDVLSGTVTALVTDGDNGAQHYQLDLRRARVVLQGIGWSKGIGVPATLSFDLLKTDAGQSVENLVLKGEGFGLTGSAKLELVAQPALRRHRQSVAACRRLDLPQADAQRRGLRHFGARRFLRSARASRQHPRSQRTGRRVPGHRRRCPCRQADRLQPGGHHRSGHDPGLRRRRDPEAHLHRQHRRIGPVDRLRRRHKRHAARRQRRRRRPPAALHRPLYPRRRRGHHAQRAGWPQRADGRTDADRRFQRAQRAGDGARRRWPQRIGRRPRRFRSDPRAFRPHDRPFLEDAAGGRDRGRVAARRRHRRHLLRPLRPAERDHRTVRHLSAGLRLQQSVQSHSDHRRDRRRRPDRGPDRRHFQGRGADGQSARLLQSAIGGGAGHLPQDLRVPALAVPASRARCGMK